MKFAVIVDRLLGAPVVVASFDHEEDAHKWASDNVHRNIWKVAQLLAPTVPFSLP